MPPPLNAKHIREAAAWVQEASEHQSDETICSHPLDLLNNDTVDEIFPDEPSSPDQRRNNQIDIRHRMRRLVARLKANVTNRGFAIRPQFKLGADQRVPSKRLEPAYPILLAL